MKDGTALQLQFAVNWHLGLHSLTMVARYIEYVCSKQYALHAFSLLFVPSLPDRPNPAFQIVVVTGIFKRHVPAPLYLMHCLTPCC